MTQIKWPSLIDDLQKRGMSQSEIGAAIGRSQAWVSDLRTGTSQEPRWSDGNALIRLSYLETLSPADLLVQALRSGMRGTAKYFADVLEINAGTTGNALRRLHKLGLVQAKVVDRCDGMVGIAPYEYWIDLGQSNK